jgi:phosphatidylethanolamine-binding protein (PEBP) family uncharacterized protein
MGRLLTMAVSAALMLVLMVTVAGCGGSSSTSRSSSTTATASQTASAATGTQGAPGSTPGNAQAPKTGESSAHFPKEVLLVSSPVFRAGSKIPALYTCDGVGISPPLRWGAIPHGTAEMALFVFDANSISTGKPLIYWAVADLQPTLKGISAGKLPPGAIVGRNSLGQARYTICPARSRGLQHYVVALLAMQHSVSVTPGFNASTLFKTALHTAAYSGAAGFTYQRR